MNAGLLARSGRAEWSRIWSVRSSWFFTVALAVVVVGLGTLVGADIGDDAAAAADGSTAWDAARFTAMFALFGVVALSVVTATADHGSGGIVPTLQWTPRRGVLLAARAAVIVATTTVIGVLLVGVASTVVWLFVPELGLPPGVGLRGLGEVALVLASGSLLGVGLGLATRSTAAALVIAIALLLVGPLVLAQLPFDWSVTIAGHLPGAGALFLIFGEGPLDDMTPAVARTTLLAWAAALLLVGGWRLVRTDAQR